MLGNLSGTHLIVIVFIVLLLFGAPKLPGLARSLGQSLKIFKSEVTTDKKGGDTAETTPAAPAASTPAEQPAAAPATPVAMDVQDAPAAEQPVAAQAASDQKPASS